MVTPVATKLASRVVLPTASVNVIVPVPPLNVRAPCPSSVLLKAMLSLPVEDVRVLAPVTITGNGNVRGLVTTVIFAPISMALALVKIKFVGGTVPPTTPPNTTFPVPATKVGVLLDVQLRVPIKLIVAPTAPPFVVLNVRAPVKVMGPLKVRLPPLVVMFPKTSIAVPPV